MSTKGDEKVSTKVEQKVMHKVAPGGAAAG
jgi:hypothetical protein